MKRLWFAMLSGGTYETTNGNVAIAMRLTDQPGEANTPAAWRTSAAVVGRRVDLVLTEDEARKLAADLLKSADGQRVGFQERIRTSGGGQ